MSHWSRRGLVVLGMGVLVTSSCHGRASPRDTRTDFLESADETPLRIRAVTSCDPCLALQLTVGRDQIQALLLGAHGTTSLESVSIANSGAQRLPMDSPGATEASLKADAFDVERDIDWKRVPTSIEKASALAGVTRVDDITVLWARSRRDGVEMQLYFRGPEEVVAVEVAPNGEPRAVRHQPVPSGFAGWSMP